MLLDNTDLLDNENEKSRILNYIDNILKVYNSNELEIIEKKIINSFQFYTEKVVKLENEKKQYHTYLYNLINFFIEDYAYLRSEKYMYKYINGEWEYVSYDNVYESWTYLLYNLKNNNIEKEFDIKGKYVEILHEMSNNKEYMYKIYSNRKSLFKKVKRGICNSDILTKKPGKILFKKTKRIFRYLGLENDELNFLFAFLGKCCCNSNKKMFLCDSDTNKDSNSVKNVDFDNHFSNINHVWCGYKIFDIIKSIQSILGPNSYIRLIKHSIMTDKFENVCCLNFPYEPSNRRFFLQQIYYLPIETRMVFTESLRNYKEKFSKYNKIGSLKYYENRQDLINSYIIKNYQQSPKHIFFIDEVFDDFKEWLYLKGIPRCIITIKMFKDFLLYSKNNKKTEEWSIKKINSTTSLTNYDDSNNELFSILLDKNTNIVYEVKKKKIIIYGQVPFLTRHHVFRTFSKECLSIDKNTVCTSKDIYNSYVTWSYNKRDEYIPGFNRRVSSFICSKSEFYEYLRIDFISIDSPLIYSQKWNIKIT